MNSISTRALLHGDIAVSMLPATDIFEELNYEGFSSHGPFFSQANKERLRIVVRFMDSSQLAVEVSVRVSQLFDHEFDSVRYPVDYTCTFGVENIPVSMLPAPGIFGS